MCRVVQTYRRSYVTKEILKLKRDPKTKFLIKVLQQFEQMADSKKKNSLRWVHLGAEGRFYVDRKRLSYQYRKKLRSMTTMKQRPPQHNSSTTKALQRLKKKLTNKYNWFYISCYIFSCIKCTLWNTLLPRACCKPCCCHNLIQDIHHPLCMGSGFLFLLF